MARKNETKFSRKVADDLKSFGHFCWFIKTQERGRRGTPDYLICLNGTFIALELKDEGEKPEPLQDWNLNNIHKAGGYAFSAMPSEWPSKFKLLQNLLNRIRAS